MAKGTPWTMPELGPIQNFIMRTAWTRKAVSDLVAVVQLFNPDRSVRSIKMKLKREARRLGYIDPVVHGRLRDKWNMNIKELGYEHVDPGSVLRQINNKEFIGIRKQLSPYQFVQESIRNNFLSTTYDWKNLAIKMKVCTKCGEEKEPSHFGYDKWRLDGLKAPCRSCRSKVVKEWREKKVN